MLHMPTSLLKMKHKTECNSYPTNSTDKLRLVLKMFLVGKNGPKDTRPQPNSGSS